MQSRNDIIECHMAKFAERIEGSGEFSIYGLNSRDVPAEALNDYGRAKEYILQNCWLGMFNAIGEHTAALLLQLYISSRDAMFDILTLLFLSENANDETFSWYLAHPSYDYLKYEIDAWLRAGDDMQIARRISYAALCYYMNYSAAFPRNDIEQLKRNIMVGCGFAPVAPAMSEGQIEIYNAIIEENSVYRLRGNAELAALLSVPGEAEPPAGDEPPPEEDKTNKRLGVACLLLALAVILTSKKKEKKHDSKDDAGT
jgi:hypothetical protein